MATGMAIMGFGGGALIAAPLSVHADGSLQDGGTPTACCETFVTMGVMYFMFMLIGVYSVRVPADGWSPAGWVAPVQAAAAGHQGPCRRRCGLAHAAVLAALWTVLCMNVTAGIGVLGQASPMIQEMFSGRVTPRRRPASSAC